MESLLQSKLLTLKPVEETDLDLLVEWRNQPENWKSFFNKFPLSKSGQKKWYDQLVENNSKKLFIIYLEDGTRIGSIGLDTIDYLNQNAEYGNLLIGNKNYEGLGYAKQASILLLNYCFFHLNMHKIYLKVFESNIKGINFYLKLGFIKEGILRQEIFADGVFNNVIVMSILRSAYLHDNKTQLL